MDLSLIMMPFGAQTTAAEVVADRGVSRAQIALAWLLQNPVVTAPIVGARTPGQLDEAIASLQVELQPRRSTICGGLICPTRSCRTSMMQLPRNSGRHNDNRR